MTATYLGGVGCGERGEPDYYSFMRGAEQVGPKVREIQRRDLHKIYILYQILYQLFLNCYGITFAFITSYVEKKEGKKKRGMKKRIYYKKTYILPTWCNIDGAL